MKAVKGLRWYILALMALGTIVNYLDRLTLGVLAPILRTHLHMSTAQYSYVVTAFQLCYSFTQPFAGFLIDLIGLQLGYFLFAFAWSTASALNALAGGWQSLALFRGLLGICEAAAIPTGVKTAALWFPARERAIATGWFNSGSSIGAMIAPPLVIWIALVWNWRVAFVVTGVMGMIVSLVWLALYRNPGEHRRLDDVERRLILDGRETEEPAAAPSARRVLNRGSFWAIAVARFLTEPAWQTFQYWIPLYMVTVRGMDIKHFALFGWLPFLAADIGCIFSGYLSRIIGAGFRLSLVNARIAGVGVGAVCMIGPALVSFFASPIVAIGLFSLGAFAHQTLSSLMYALVTDRFEKADVGTATGCAGMAGYLGAAGFSLLLGALAHSVGFAPMFALLPAFDLIAFAVLAVVLGERASRRLVPHELRT